MSTIYQSPTMVMTFQMYRKLGCRKHTCLLAEQLEECNGEPSCLLLGSLRPAHFRGCNHLHGRCNFPDVRHGLDPRFHCKSGRGSRTVPKCHVPRKCTGDREHNHTWAYQLQEWLRFELPRRLCRPGKRFCCCHPTVASAMKHIVPPTHLC
jgi:hypothetical protein